MHERDFQPDWMSPPGATITDILEQRGISAGEFAKVTGYSQERVDRLLNGRAAITMDVARLLEKTIGASATFWLSREEKYREGLGRLQSIGNENAARAWLGGLPIADMVRLGWIESRSGLDQKVDECLRFFAVPDVRAWQQKYSDVLSAVAFRTSPTFESEPSAVIAWLRFGEIRSSEIACRDWNAKAFKNALSEIRQLTRRKSPSSFIPDLRRLCANAGVAVVVAQSPKGCRASGATRFLSPSKALILLSFRYLSDDQFWFTFFHEAAHLLLHSHKALFLEDGSEVTHAEENEANSFAEKILVPPEARPELATMPITKEDIMRFAVKSGISRGIVVGQLQHMKRIAPSQFNWMKRHFRRQEISS
jgi:HTH-type transcriptional regulator/antitoxin HigA